MRRLRSRRHNSYVDYLLPFLIIVCIGVILVLAYSLWNALFSREQSQAAYMHIVEGGAQMKTWGTDDFFSLNSDALIMEGDEIKSYAGSKLIVEFFDGTLMRVDGGSDVVFEQIDNESKVPLISVVLTDGNLWFNKLYADAGKTEINVKLKNLQVNSMSGSIFDVGNDLDKVICVLEGEDLVVDVLDQSGEKVIENENVGVGQEALFNDAVFDKYWKYQNPSVIEAVTDEFKQGEWYTWNIAEDSSPTVYEKNIEGGVKFVKVEPQVINPEEPVAEEIKEGVKEEPAEQPAEETAEEEEVQLGPLTTPTITSVSGGTQKDANGFYVISSNPAVLKGAVSGASKVVVNGWTLQKFTAGDTVWNYYANSDYGLMKAGENVYEVYALDANEVKSEPLYVKVLYQPVAETRTDESEATEGTTEGDTTEET